MKTNEWKVILSPQVEQFLNNVSNKDKKQIKNVLNKIKQDPYKNSTPLVISNNNKKKKCRACGFKFHIDYDTCPMCGNKNLGIVKK